MNYKNHPLISVNSSVCHGKPVVAGTRILVKQILADLACGQSAEEIIAQYPNLTKDKINAALSFASDLAGFEELEAA